MKKIIALALAAVVAGALTACGAGNVRGSSAPAASSSAPVSSVPEESAFEDSLAGLGKYLAAHSAISGNGVKMQADFIGASAGVKYQFGLNGKDNVAVELYEFSDPSSPSAKAVLDEVKSKGVFTIMDQQVPAVLSDSGKYLMIYRDSVNSEENKSRQEQAEKLFKAFKK